MGREMEITEKQLRQFMSDEKLGCAPNVQTNNEMVRAMRKLKAQRDSLATDFLCLRRNGIVVIEDEEEIKKLEGFVK